MLGQVGPRFEVVQTRDTNERSCTIAVGKMQTCRLFRRYHGDSTTMNLPSEMQTRLNRKPFRLPQRLIELGVVLVIMVLMIAIPNWYFSWRGNQAAKEHVPIVQAIVNYRAETGLLPYTLDDLQRRFPVDIPEGVGWSNNGSIGSLYIFSGIRISYEFDEGNYEGWHGRFANVSLPKVTPTVSVVTGQQRVEAALAEYDRRIADYQEEEDNCRIRTAKMAMLFSLGRSDDLHAECLAARKVYPDWWRAQYGAVKFSPDICRAEHERALTAWVERSPGFVHSWYLANYLREEGRHAEALVAIKKGSEHPLTSLDDDATWVPHAFAFDAATYACQQNAPNVALAVCDSWSRPEGVYDYPSKDLPAFRAAALLQLGQIEEAKSAIAKVLAAEKKSRLWAGNLDQLHAAIKRGDREYIYDPGQVYEGFGQWKLFPPPEFQPAETNPPVAAPSSSD